jgi:hypothetical protein
MRIVTAVLCCFVACLAGARTASAQTKPYIWADIDCRQSRIVAWQGLKCRATNIVTGEGNIGAFRRWTAFGTGPQGYYVHMFVWEAQNTFSYLAADETTADFVTWMFEYGKSITQLSPVARHKEADYVTFTDGTQGRKCIGFRRMGGFQRGGYNSVTGGILCAPSGTTVTDNDVALFIDNVRLQGTPGASRR